MVFESLGKYRDNSLISWTRAAQTPNLAIISGETTYRLQQFAISPSDQIKIP